MEQKTNTSVELMTEFRQNFSDFADKLQYAFEVIEQAEPELFSLLAENKVSVGMIPQQSARMYGYDPRTRVLLLSPNAVNKKVTAGALIAGLREVRKDIEFTENHNTLVVLGKRLWDAYIGTSLKMG